MDGPIPNTNGETWPAVELALRHGQRGIPGGSSLAQLLAAKRGVKTGWHFLGRDELLSCQPDGILLWSNRCPDRDGICGCSSRTFSLRGIREYLLLRAKCEHLLNCRVWVRQQRRGVYAEESTAFNIWQADLGKLNSMTKYLLILTYHCLGERDILQEEVQIPFTGRVIGTEKVDGTNARLIFCPDGSALVGSREDLLWERRDLIGSPAMGIGRDREEVGPEIGG